jgi:hypothetical protein
MNGIVFAPASREAVSGGPWRAHAATPGAVGLQPREWRARPRVELQNRDVGRFVGGVFVHAHKDAVARLDLALKRAEASAISRWKSRFRSRG